ncbi:hypothetical protein FRC12_012987 [Ceratobasidium sp. 428]|nr:hypothetical protein FRC12_012987 [Ceratobasidium sp. 428]
MRENTHAQLPLFRLGVKLVWRELAGPVPLLALFCDQTLEPLNRAFMVLMLTIPETVSPERLERSCIYADCVRKVTGIGPLGPQGNDVRWSGIHRLLPQTPVAANVNVIEDTWGSPDSADVVEVLLGPSTSTLDCRGSDGGRCPVEQVTRLLERAHAVKSNLTALAVRTPRISDDEAAAAASRIAMFQGLSSVEIPSQMLTESMLDCLRSLPGIRHLALGVPPEGARFPFWESFGQGEEWAGRVSFAPSWSHKARGADDRRLSQPPRPSGVGSRATRGPHRQRGFGIEDLSIVFSAASEHSFLLPPPVLALLFTLNLRRLSLYAAHLPTDSPGLAMIDGKWPLLSHLVMPCQRAGPADLLRLASREPLQHLWVDVKALRPGEDISISETEVERSIRPIRLEGPFEIQETGEDVTEAMAR